MPHPVLARVSRSIVTSGKQSDKMSKPRKLSNAPRKLARLKPDENAAWDVYFADYCSNVRNDSARADRFAWRRLQEDFLRLKKYYGAKP
jgi:hypothetical protein